MTGGDPKAIADQAVAAMNLVVSTARTQLPTPPSITPKPSRTPDTDRKHVDNKGKGDHEGDD